MELHVRLRRQKLIFALLAGGGLALVHNAMPSPGPAVVRIDLLYLGLFPLTVLFLSRPLDSYRQSVAIAVAVILGWITVKFVTEAVTPEYPGAALPMCILWGVYGLLMLVANVLTASVGVWTRRRFHPVYAVGLCQRCGYDLTGNVSGICPEMV